MFDEIIGEKKCVWKEIFITVFLFIHTFFSPAILSNIHRFIIIILQKIWRQKWNKIRGERDPCLVKIQSSLSWQKEGHSS